MSQLSLPLLRTQLPHYSPDTLFYLFIIEPDKLTFLPAPSAAWIIINTMSEMSMVAHVKCVPWFHEANKSSDIKRDEEGLGLRVSQLRFKSDEVKVARVPIHKAGN